MKLVPAALWTEPGTADLFLCLEEEGDWGSSIVQESRRHLDRDHPINVQLIDLAGYILENFGPEDRIVLKLDVEGAEYHLVPHLIRTGAIELVDEIHVEWHDEWFVDTSVDLEAPKALLEEAALKFELRVEEWPY